MKHIFIVGPTASGKSELALRIAQKIEREICSMDAYQIYRKLDIGTGKPLANERKKVPHHLIDFVDPSQSFSVADYLQTAEKVLNLNKKKRFVWVGGTGLYYHALRYGLNPAPSISSELQNELSQWSLEKLQLHIREKDPQWAESADLQNPRRMIRALGVVMETGKKLSEWQREPANVLISEEEKAKTYCLEPDRGWLAECIDRRVELMWKSGWIEEVECLRKNREWVNSQSAKAIGYSQVLQYVEGKCSQEECLREIKLRTRQYAKRQTTWFRREKKVESLSFSTGEERERCFSAIIESL